MENQLVFVMKVFLLSAGISVLIKYVGPNLGIKATTTNALIFVLLPVAIMASALLWRLPAKKQN